MPRRGPPIAAGSEDVRVFTRDAIPEAVAAYRALHNGLDPHTVVVAPPPPPPQRFIVRLGRTLASEYAKDVDDHDGRGRKEDIPHRHPFAKHAGPGQFHDARGRLFFDGGSYDTTHRGIEDRPMSKNDAMTRYIPEPLRFNPSTDPGKHLAVKVVGAGILALFADVVIDVGVDKAADAVMPAAWTPSRKADVKDAAKIAALAGAAYGFEQMDYRFAAIATGFIAAQDTVDFSERKWGAVSKLRALVGAPATTTRGLTTGSADYFNQPSSNPSDAELLSVMEQMRRDAA